MRGISALSKTQMCLESTVKVAPPAWLRFDATHWILTLSLAIPIVELVVSTAPNTPYIRLLAMVHPSMLFSSCICVLCLDMGSIQGARAPFRISSIPKGEKMRPGLYTLLEDIVTLTGSGNSYFRMKLNRRWAASAVFRKLIFQVSLFWSISGIIVAVVLTVIVFTTAEDVGFGIAWVTPYLWIVSWACITKIWVSRIFQAERTHWPRVVAGAGDMCEMGLRQGRRE